MLRNRLVKGLLGVSAVAALFGALAVQAQTTDPQSGAGQGTATGQGAAAQGGAASALSRADQKIVKDIAMANMSEIEAARAAQAKSQDEQVKNFAQQMIDDHTKALGDVQQLAQTKGVTLPSTLDRAHKAKADKLAALSGDAFDRAYMAQAGVAEHKKTHAMLRQAQNRTKDADIKALVARLMPTVDQHLNSAQQLHGKKAAAQGNAGTGAEKTGQ